MIFKFNDNFLPFPFLSKSQLILSLSLCVSICFIKYLKLLSGEKEVDKIISKFIKEEEENYALFNYVNELSHEIEQLNETVQQLQDSIGKLVLISIKIN